MMYRPAARSTRDGDGVPEMRTTAALPGFSSFV